MPAAAHISGPTRTDPAVRSILRSWRELTGGGADADRDRRTLVACSGGADSSALALALAAGSRDLVIAHLVHDMRPASSAHADRDAARDLADALDLEFAEGEIRVAQQPGNAEANARRARYDRLERMALERGARFVTTAHHADDQLETLLMRLMRGAGPRGLAGIRPSRTLGSRGVVLVRPMLGVDRASAERLCAEAGWSWREDETNADLSRMRAAIRHRALPELRSIRSDAARNATRSAHAIAETADMLDARARDLHAMGDHDPEHPGARAWARSLLRAEPVPVVCALLRTSVGAVASTGLDRLNAETLRRVARAIRDRSGEPRRFALRAGTIHVDAAFVRIAPADEPGAPAREWDAHTDANRAHANNDKEEIHGR